MAHLNRDVEFNFHFHTVRAKAGTPVKMVKDNPSGWFLEPRHVETDSPTGKGTIWEHDTRHYYIWAPQGSVNTGDE